MYIASNESVEKQEQIGRGVFLSLFSHLEWTESPDRFSSWDISGSTKNIDLYGEIKTRNLKANDFPTTFLECKKYDALMELANRTKTGRAFYFVTFADGTAYRYDLKKIDVERYRNQRLMKEVTLEGQQKMVMKDIYELPLWHKMVGVERY